MIYWLGLQYFEIRHFKENLKSPWFSNPWLSKKPHISHFIFFTVTLKMKLLFFAIPFVDYIPMFKWFPRDPAPEPHSSQSRRDSEIEKRLWSICVAINILSNVVLIDRGAIIIKAKYIDEDQASFKW